ncbi:hypothetical protein F5X68DRAFT_275917 [Plectosphaerella plurivora]|uniref:Gfd2/YDR514C-like C-terminal domain-containing protein n=1 Tax=Plectosphaerella plurivora TaxID=936078 RepID=A0A9P8VD63_9PEZI|nr:hypothetical protein F5X68DRAFT_275917 [Plectosphaerella plurivora]
MSSVPRNPTKPGTSGALLGGSSSASHNVSGAVGSSKVGPLGVASPPEALKRVKKLPEFGENDWRTPTELFGRLYHPDKLANGIDFICTKPMFPEDEAVTMQETPIPSLSSIRRLLGLHPHSPDPNVVPTLTDDYVFVALDFEGLCRDALWEGPSQYHYRATPPSEIGVCAWVPSAVMTARTKIMAKDPFTGKMERTTQRPGLYSEDRGRNWWQTLSTFHIIPAEFVSHINHECPDSPAQPKCNAFGKREYPALAHVPHRLASIIDSKRKENRSGPLRKVIFLGWDIAMERQCLAVLGFTWKPEYEFWDLQEACRPSKLPIFTDVLQAGLRPAAKLQPAAKPALKMVLPTLGLSYHDVVHGSILDSAANDANFEMQALLAVLYIPDNTMQRWIFETTKRNTDLEAVLVENPVAFTTLPPAWSKSQLDLQDRPEAAASDRQPKLGRTVYGVETGDERLL